MVKKNFAFISVCILLIIFICSVYGENSREIKYYPLRGSDYNYIEMDNDIDYRFEVIDNTGKIYSNNELGYFYPIDEKYCAVHYNNDSKEQYLSCIWDRNGNLMLKAYSDNKDGYFHSAKVYGDFAVIEVSPADYTWQEAIHKMSLYNIANGEVVISNMQNIWQVGGNLFCCQSRDDYIVNNEIEVIDTMGNVILNDKFKNCSAMCGGYITLNKDNVLYVINSLGQLQKRVYVDLSKYEVVRCYGSNVFLHNKIENSNVLYRCFSNKFVSLGVYDDLICHETGDFETVLSNGNTVIYNADGTIKYKTKNGEYVDSIDTSGLYLIYSPIKNTEKYENCVGEGSSYVYGANEFDAGLYNGKIINSKGEVIEENIYSMDNTFNADKNIVCYLKDNKLVVREIESGKIIFEKAIDKPESVEIINGGVRLDGEYVYFY